MSSDVMRVRLHLRRVRVLAVVSDTPLELVVEVESAVRRPRCPGCGAACSGVHDVRVKEVRDLEVSGRAVTLLWKRRRLVCGGCDRRFVEGHPAFEGRLTARLARRLVADARAMPIRQVARRHGVGWHQVNDLVRAWAGVVAERRRSLRCRVLLVDETSIRKRHRYVTVIVNADTGQTLAMVPHRSTAALAGFLAQQGHKWCKQVKVVVTDGSPAYKAAIDARLGHARHVLDRFHVIRWFSSGLVAVRRDVQRRQRQGGKPAFDPEVFKARFMLLRRQDALTTADQDRLDGLFEAHPRLRTAWQALQQLRGIYEAQDHDQALEALNRLGDLYLNLPGFYAGCFVCVSAWRPGFC
ncbi:ISL3 family transposase [Candidatus Poriferisocius sp.]|uniref:ISL3 family transposase n=1 Tax=Candidatus Poriferisocius sp. TaxID=3101276 RepID=UPI003B5AB1A0